MVQCCKSDAGRVSEQKKKTAKSELRQAWHNDGHQGHETQLAKSKPRRAMKASNGHEGQE
eukprot:3565135-Amphidinium_carterae.1